MKIQSLFFILLVFQSLLVFGQNSSKVEIDNLKYRSGMCYGTCPLINCTIEKNKTVKIDRIIFRKFGEIDTAQSGTYLGRLTDQEWLQFSKFLSSKSLTQKEFPPKFCCDGSLVTITLKKNGKEQQFRSMFPQNEAVKFIGFLHQVSISNRHKKINYDDGLFEKLR